MENRAHVCNPTGPHTHTIVFLHGRDSFASEFAEEFFESQASDDRTLPEIFPNIKWVFPVSKMRKSARFGVEMSQWFDMWSVEAPEEKLDLQIEGLNESINDIDVVVKQEAELVGPENVILGGISQGCATAIWTLMCREGKLGGFVGLSSWLPSPSIISSLAEVFEETMRSDTQGICDESVISSLRGFECSRTPILLQHCRDDEVVPVGNGRALREELKDLGMAVDYKEYEHGGHWLNEPQGVDDIVEFLTGILKGN